MGARSRPFTNVARYHPPVGNGSMTFREAAEEVLRRHSPGAPLHYRRISELALADGLVVSKGTTPEATMGAQLYTT
jgi:restriction system protein